MAQKVYDHQTKQWVFLEDQETPSAITSGRYSYETGVDVPVVDPEGKVVSVSSDQIGNAFATGYRIPTKVDSDADVARRTEENLTRIAEDNQLATGVGGALAAATGGLSDVALAAIDEDAAAMRDIGRQVNPGTELTGQVLGTILPTPAGKAGAALSRGIRSAIPQAAGVTGRIIGAAGGEAAQGAFFGLGQGVSDAALSPEEASSTAEKILAHSLSGAVMGGALGAGFQSVVEAAPLVSQALKAPGSGLIKTARGSVKRFLPDDVPVELVDDAALRNTTLNSSFSKIERDLDKVDDAAGRFVDKETGVLRRGLDAEIDVAETAVKTRDAEQKLLDRIEAEANSDLNKAAKEVRKALKDNTDSVKAEFESQLVAAKGDLDKVRADMWEKSKSNYSIIDEYTHGLGSKDYTDPTAATMRLAARPEFVNKVTDAVRDNALKLQRSRIPEAVELGSNLLRQFDGLVENNSLGGRVANSDMLNFLRSATEELGRKRVLAPLKAVKGTVSALDESLTKLAYEVPDLGPVLQEANLYHKLTQDVNRGIVNAAKTAAKAPAKRQHVIDFVLNPDKTRSLDLLVENAHLVSSELEALGKVKLGTKEAATAYTTLLEKLRGLKKDAAGAAVTPEAIASANLPVAPSSPLPSALGNYEKSVARHADTAQQLAQRRAALGDAASAADFQIQAEQLSNLNRQMKYARTQNLDFNLSARDVRDFVRNYFPKVKDLESRAANLADIQAEYAALQANGAPAFERLFYLRKAQGKPVTAEEKTLIDALPFYKKLEKYSELGVGLRRDSLLSLRRPSMVGLALEAVSSNPITLLKRLSLAESAVNRATALVDTTVRKSIDRLTSPRGVQAGIKVALSPSRKEKKPDFSKQISRLMELSDPERLSRFVANQVANAAEPVNPQVQAAIAAQYAARISFLIPKAPQDPLADKYPTFEATRVPPADEDLYKFDQYVMGAERPLEVIERIGEGRATPQAIEAFKTLWPQLYTSYKTKLFETLAETGAKLSYDQRISLGTALGVTTDPTLDPAFMSSLYSSWQAEQEQAAQQKSAASQPRPGRQMKTDLAQDSLTDTQRITNKG